VSRRVVIGVGCRAGCSADTIAALARRALADAGFEAREARMATLEAKGGEDGLREAARALGLPLELVSLERLQAQAARILTPSRLARERFGAPNVAEAAALAAAGEGAILKGPRIAADGATCAIAYVEERA